KPNKKGEYRRGIYKLGRHKIRDDHKFKKHYLTIDDIIVYSSNIGILQLVQRLSGQDFSTGLKSFGITEKTGIDLPYEKKGRMPQVYKFRAGESKGKDNVYKATVSYGQGMTSTFMQMIKAYTVFNNDGFIVSPQIVSALVTPNNKIIKLDLQEPVKVISKRSANNIKRMLIKTVDEGTGIYSKIDGLEIGGKTGTAQIARRGRYLKRYISSFFGFANDKNNKYTIGVTVFEPVSTGKYWYYHYASQSAAPVTKVLTP
ncbi:penicillin-binding protein 2, partial [Arcobacter sp. HD9-500m-PIT-SAG02]